MRLYFSRHGESEANVRRIPWNQLEGYGLTDKGREQAEALADNLAGIVFSALYCSPLLRAVQTAQIVGRRLDLTPEVADGLCEWNVGILEGQGYSKETWALHNQVMEQWMKHDNHDARIQSADGNHSGESYNDVAARFMPLIEGLEETYCGTGANVLLISHAGTLACMLPLLLSNVNKASTLTRGHLLRHSCCRRAARW